MTFYLPEPTPTQKEIADIAVLIQRTLLNIERIFTILDNDTTLKRNESLHAFSAVQLTF